MGNDTFRLSRETKKALGENSDFFESIRQVNQEISLSLKGGDLEARTEAETQDNGDRAVTFVYPLDDNEAPGDGRIYLKDKFVFDAGESKLKSYQRSFELHPSVAANPKWQEWLKKFQATVAPVKPDDPKLASFAVRVALTYSRSITSDIKAALKTQVPYLTVAGEAGQDVDDKWTLKIGDEQASFSKNAKDDEIIYTLTVPVDSDKDPKNGRIFFSDQFTLNAKSLKLKSFQRSWSVAPEVPEPMKSALKAGVDKLNAGKGPKNSEAEKFLTAILPALEKSAAPKGPVALPEVQGALPKEFVSSFQRLRKHGEKVAQAETEALQDSLPLAKALAADILEHRHDAASAWLSGEKKFDLSARKQALEGIFQKAIEAAKSGPSADLLSTLRKLDLNAEEKEALAPVLADPIFRRFAGVVADADGGLRAHNLLVFAREELLKNGYGASAMAIATNLKDREDSRAEAGKILAFLGGGGGFGTKAEYLLPAFVDQTSKPSMLLAMAGAGFAGPMAELAGLKLLRFGGAVGGVGRFGSALAGITGEAAAFTTLHKTFDSFSHNPDKVWEHTGGEIASGTLLFGAMRLSHAGTGWVSRGMAEGRFGSVLGGRMPAGLEGAPLPAHWVAPSGRVAIGNVWGNAAAVPALTRWGERLSGLTNHGAAIGTMGFTGYLGQKIGLHPANDQTMGGHLFDATVMYTQAMVGFGLMNGLTGGRLQPELAEIRMRTQQQVADVTADPNAGPRLPKWELVFAAARAKAAERAARPWDGGKGFPRIAAAKEKAASLFIERNLPQARIDQILADRLTPDSQKATALSKLWRGGKEYLGRAAVRLDGWGLPVNGVIEFFSLWRLANQRALKETIKGLESRIEEVKVEKESALRQAADAQAEVERLTEVLDHEIEEELPTLIPGFDPASIEGTRAEQTGVVKAKIAELTGKREEAERKHAEAVSALEAKTRELAERDEQLAAATARGEDRDRLAGEVQVLNDDKNSLEAQETSLREQLQSLTDQLAEEKRAGSELSQQLVQKGNAFDEVRNANVLLNRELGAARTQHAEAVETARQKDVEIGRLTGELAQAREEIENYETPVLTSESEELALDWAAPGQAVTSEIALSRGMAVEELVKSLRAQLQAKVEEIEGLEGQIEWEKSKTTADASRASRIKTLQDAHRAGVDEANKLVVRVEKAKKVAAATLVIYLQNKVKEEEGKGSDLLRRLTESESAAETLRANLRDAEAMSADLERQRDALAERLSTKSTELEKAEETLADLRGQIEARQREIVELNDTVGGLNETIADLERDGNELRAQIEEKGREILRMQGEVAKAQEDAQIASNTAELLTTEREDNLQAEAERLSQELEKLKLEQLRLEGSLEQKTTELEREKGKHGRTTTRAEEAETKLKQAEANLAKKKADYDDLDRQHRELMDEAERADIKYAEESIKADRTRQELEIQLENKERERLEIVAEAEALRGPAQSVPDLESRIQQLQVEAEDGERLRREVEDRAVAQERRANELDDALTASRVEIEEVQRERDALNAEKTEALASLEAERQKVQEKIDALEKVSSELRGVRDELNDANNELTALKTFPREQTVTHTPGQVEAAGRIRELEIKIEELTGDNEQLLRDVAKLTNELADFQRASETVIGETMQEKQSVQKEAERVKQEADRAQDSRNIHKTKAEALATRVEEFEARIRELEAHVANLTARNEGLRSLLQTRDKTDLFANFFHGIDPRKARAVIPLSARALLTRHPNGAVVGEAQIVSGGMTEPSLHYVAENGTIVSGKTSIGVGRKVQEDSIYIAHYRLAQAVRLPDGTTVPESTEVLILGLSDGAGGEGGGNTASSGFLQGVHARVVESAYNGLIPDARDLFIQGAHAVEVQKEANGSVPKATGTGMIAVLIGDQGTVATAGDSPLIWQRPLADGSFETRGYTNLDIFPAKNVITQGVAMVKDPDDPDGPKSAQFNVYKLEGLRKGDRLYSGSDGNLENIIGEAYKSSGSAMLRIRPQGGQQGRQPDQTVFHNLNLASAVLRGNDNVAELLNDLAIENMKEGGLVRNFMGVDLQMHPSDHDNSSAMTAEIGDVTPLNLKLPEYKDLEFVFDAATTRKMFDAAEKSTAKSKRDVPVEIPMEDIEFDEADVMPPPTQAVPRVPPRPRPPRPQVPRTPPPAPDSGGESVVADWHFPDMVESVLLGSQKPDPAEFNTDEYFQVVEDPAVSRFQARIFIRDGKYFIQHFGRNPTFVRMGNLNLVLKVENQTEEIRPGAHVEMGNTAFTFHPPANPPVAPAPRPEVFFYKGIDGAELIKVLRKYAQSLKNLYGENSNFVQAPLTRIYKNFPQIEEVFNPDLMNAAVDGPAQAELLKKLETALVEAADANRADDAVKKEVMADYELVKNGKKPGPKPGSAVIKDLMMRYEQAFAVMVPDKTAWMHPEMRGKLAQAFAYIYALKPEFEKDFNPDSIANLSEDELRRKSNKLILQFHPDRNKVTDEEIFRQAMQAVGHIKDTLAARNASPEIEPGLWRLEAARNYVVGRDPKSQIPVSDETLSSNHFKIHFEFGSWTVEDLNSQNGTFLQGMQLQTGRGYALQHGAILTAGNSFFRFEIMPDGGSLLRLLQANPAGQAAPQPFSMNYPPNTVPYSLGRQDINDGMMSQHHLDFRLMGLIWEVRDAGSTNGTLLNLGSIAGAFDPTTKTRVPGEYFPIKSGDRIIAGLTHLEIQVRPDGVLSVTQIPWNPPKAAEMPIAHNGQFYLKSAKRATLRTFKGEPGAIEIDASNPDSYFFNISSTFFKPKVYGILDRVNDVVLLTVKSKGLEVQPADSQARRYRPVNGQEIPLHPNDRLFVEGKEIILN